MAPTIAKRRLQLQKTRRYRGGTRASHTIQTSFDTVLTKEESEAAVYFCG